MYYILDFWSQHKAFLTRITCKVKSEKKEVKQLTKLTLIIVVKPESMSIE